MRVCVELGQPPAYAKKSYLRREVICMIAATGRRLPRRPGIASTATLGAAEAVAHAQQTAAAAAMLQLLL